MEKDYLQMLAQVVLPVEILEYFSIRGIEQSATEIHISLDEKMSPELSSDAHYESKGFMGAECDRLSDTRPQGYTQDSTSAMDRYAHR